VGHSTCLLANFPRMTCIALKHLAAIGVAASGQDWRRNEHEAMKGIAMPVRAGSLDGA